MLASRLVDKAADVGDDRVALVRPRDHAVLHVDDEEAVVGRFSSVVTVPRTHAGLLVNPR